MATFSEIKKQLLHVGYRVSLWQMAEVKELCNVCGGDEVIEFATNGHYEGGFALLVSTNHRLLLVDKKPMFLTLDSITYTMIQEVLFTYRLLNSTIHIFTSNKTLDFTSWNHAPLRSIFTYTQTRMLQSRMGTDTYLSGGNQFNPEFQSTPRFTNDLQLPKMPNVQVTTNNPGQVVSDEYFIPSQTDFESLSSTEPGGISVNEQNFDEIPNMPLPQSSPLKTESNIAMLGSSALVSSKNNPLIAYKTPPLARSRYVNPYL